MNAFRALILCVLPLVASAVDPYDPAPGLEAEIAAWKPGNEVPRRLLAFPDGDLPSARSPDIEASIISVDRFIARIENDSLLEAVVFAPRVESASRYAAAVRLVDHKGIPWFASELARRDVLDWELQVLQQAFDVPYARVQVAFIARNLMTEPMARHALGELKSALVEGETWKDAYGKVADAYPESDRPRSGGAVPRTRVGYWFDGWIAASGFSASSQGFKFDHNLPRAHLGKVIGSRGIRILSSNDGVYLYNVVETWVPHS